MPRARGERCAPTFGDMTSSDSPPLRPVMRPAQVAGAIAQLAALGVVGVAAFSLLFTLLGVGIGLVFVLGIGLIILVGLVYVLFALGWLLLEWQGRRLDRLRAAREADATKARES